VRLRVDGFFRDLEPLPADLLPRVVARLKVLAGLSVFRTGEPQDGRLRHEGPRGACDLRLSTLPVVGGEKAVVRLFDLAARPRVLADLGLPAASLAALASLADLPAGAVVVTGPCSSGKTTTLYALARAILARDAAFANVVSVEDPVEQLVPGMSQTEVDPARGLTFPAVLRALLRQDPEVLLVGETRDPETARLAIEAAFTGHRVLTSLHVGRAEEVPRRLALLGVPEYLVADALRGVVSQRHLRAACGGCRGAGCEACAGTGHRGRIAVAEVARVVGGRVELVTPDLEALARQAVEEARTTEEERRRVLRAAGGAS
jgi:type II secretory ATPase GspE/PulE/Tfp pilus assembly ATPase PilB-like protein